MYKGLITAITCTGNRPEAFSLCQKFIKSQTRPVDQWIVVYDSESEPEIEKSSSIELVPGPRLWTPGLNTHRFNMEEALKKVAGDVLIIFEDDDYYAPTYVEEITRYLKAIKACGLSYAKYYHVGMPGWKELPNHSHASLSQTAIHKSLFPLLEEAVNSGELYFDLHFWRALFQRKVACALFANSNLSIGMKGMPGRTGITPSHVELRDYRIDSGHAKLTEWIGQDVELYKPYQKKVMRNESKKVKIQSGQKSIQNG